MTPLHRANLFSSTFVAVGFLMQTTWVLRLAERMSVAVPEVEGYFVLFLILLLLLLPFVALLPKCRDKLAGFVAWEGVVALLAFFVVTQWLIRLAGKQ